MPSILLRNFAKLAAGLCVCSISLAQAEIGPVLVEVASTPSPTLVAINHKVETMVIPHVDIQGKPLGEAIEFLRSEAQRVDVGPLDERGINIFLKLPRVEPGKESPASLPISLTMEHPTLLTALQAVAAKVGMKVKVEEYALSIVPIGEITDRLITATVQVPSEYFGNSLQAGGDRADMQKFFAEKGMTFPPGSSAVYLQLVNKLVVRNTGENIGVLKEIFAKATSGQNLDTRDAALQLGDSFQIQFDVVPAAESSVLSHEYTVDSDGNINLPYVHKVNIARLTVIDAQKKIEQAYISGGYFEHPTVTIATVEQQKLITVGGEVNNKGRIAYQPGMTVLGAIKAAGGWTIYGAPKFVRLIRGDKVQRINCIKAQSDSTLDVALQPGDNVQVPLKPQP